MCNACNDPISIMPPSGQGHQVQADPSGEPHSSISKILQVKTCTSTQLEIVSGCGTTYTHTHTHREREREKTLTCVHKYWYLCVRLSVTALSSPDCYCESFVICMHSFMHAYSGMMHKLKKYMSCVCTHLSLF